MYNLAMQTKLLKVDKTNSDEMDDVSTQAAELISNGGLVGFATETVYGIAALADNQATMDRLRELKSRPENPFSVHLAAPQDVFKFVSKGQVPLAARFIIENTWPGPVTMLLQTGGSFADEALNPLHDVLTNNNIIGLRCPDESFSSLMLGKVSGVVVAPSANLIGQPSPKNADDVMAELDGKLDMVVDSGPSSCGKDSTILLFDGEDYKIVRHGVYDERMVKNLAARKIAFVCTGNTCRSPMAEGLCRMILAERFGCDEQDLVDKGITVDSFGMMAWDGDGPTAHAVEVVAENGGNISEHRSRKMTISVLECYDRIYCMTNGHLQQIRRLAGGFAKNAQLLDEFDVHDPVGGGKALYIKTACQIERALRNRLNDGNI